MLEYRSDSPSWLDVKYLELTVGLCSLMCGNVQQKTVVWDSDN